MAFPNVPNVPGVPPIPRVPGAAGQIIDALISDVASALGFFATPQWGLFLNGAPAIVSDNVVSFGYSEDWLTPEYPVEDGLFETFNKVQRPFIINMSFSASGSIADRSDYLAQFEEIIGSTDLYDAVTPEKVYENVNPINYNFRRTHYRGVSLITVDLRLKLVRSAASTTFASTATGQQAASGQTTTQISIRPGGSSQSFAQINQPQSPSAAPVVNSGTVQPTEGGQFDLSQALP